MPPSEPKTETEILTPEDIFDLAPIAGATLNAGHECQRPYEAGPPPYQAGPRPYEAGPRPYEAGPRPYEAGPRPYEAGPPPYDARPPM